MEVFRHVLPHEVGSESILKVLLRGEERIPQRIVFISSLRGQLLYVLLRVLADDVVRYLTESPGQEFDQFWVNFDQF